MGVNERIKALGIELPIASVPIASYIPVKQVGNQLYVSGQVPLRNPEGNHVYVGKVGEDCTVEFAQEGAKSCILNMLAVLKQYLGDLDKIKNIIKLQAYVNGAEGFDKPYLVANGASEFLIEIFGASGRHARTVVCVKGLPNNVLVEIDAVVEV